MLLGTGRIEDSRAYLKIADTGHAVQAMPMPIDAMVHYERSESGTVLRSKVMRRWHGQDIGKGGCSRCGQCTAQRGPDGQAMCFVEIHGFVSLSSAASLADVL